VTEIVPDAIFESFADIAPEAPDVLDALKEMPIDLASVLSLHYLCGKTCQEIADTVGQSITTIYRKKSEAIKILESILRQQKRGREAPLRLSFAYTNHPPACGICNFKGQFFHFMARAGFKGEWKDGISTSILVGQRLHLVKFSR
jgi:hypothetical protein